MARSDWHVELPSRGVNPDIAENLARFFDATSPNDLRDRELTFQSFATLLGNNDVDEDIILVANALIVLGMFDTVFYLYDQYSGEFHVFEYSEILEAKAEGALAHPRTGKLIENFESQVHPLFIFKSDRFEPQRGAR